MSDLDLYCIKVMFYIMIFVGSVAQWITRLTTDQKIPGSSPGRFVFFCACVRME